MKSIYLIVAERSDEPCSAEIRAFSKSENAEREFDKLLEKVINVFDLTAEQEAYARRTYEESNKETFIVNLKEDEGVQCYYNLETIFIEDM